ncbi:competence type IV pilus ATPase ComGA [Virgibacillus sp. 179-BFC.A HS]|uniref:Competence type IV pilus ATPase ComGA n=1 Tax=Tigheibacillus jepli TaxID=3035914 RepID=A0ABU5CGY8_9BACI|nr:competence type IV pilus ATPase ComGA [Virgibacillus sp. 179-BFC.A HS]MDY0405591.1 competence type IV pilus ATPase ComGA [Virgibacillus sp. 179-BFC.A HS]
MNPAAKLCEKVLTAAIRIHASDIHFYPFTEESKIYFRVHGQRIFYQTIPISQYDLLLTYYKFTSGMDIGETRKPQNGTLSFQTKENTFHLRLSTLPVNKNESLAIRLLPQEKALPLEESFLFSYQLKKLRQWMHYRAGLILFTGPTGSGKTSTLYSLLQSVIKDGSYQTITLEDPIEKNLSDILQVQINEKAGITYQAGLKAALRHDPDIIMVGEIRDDFTAQFAFEASLTGHLVLSTLHAKNAKGTIERLLEMGLKRNDLQQSLSSGISTTCTVIL